jgi:hypothetical protein
VAEHSNSTPEIIQTAPGTCAACEVITNPLHPDSEIVSLCAAHRQPHGDLTPAEFHLHDLLAQVVGEWSNLEYKHPNEFEEMQFYVHALQRLLMAHAAMRRYPTYFTQPSGAVRSST